MNNARKGNKYELEVEKMLVKDGWRIFFRARRTRWGPQDFGGVFDIVAGKGSVRKFVQVTTLGAESARRKAIKDFITFFDNDYEYHELWVRLPGGGFRIEKVFRKE